MPIEPAGKGREALGADAVDSPATLGRCADQAGGFQKLEVLHDRRARDRQTVCEIALAVGFGDISTFNREFRRRFGATPSTIRHPC